MSLRRVAGVSIHTLCSIYTEASLWRQLLAMLLAWATVLNASGASVMIPSSQPARLAGSPRATGTGTAASSLQLPALASPRSPHSRPIQLASLTHVLPRIHASGPPPNGISTISSNFNGTAIAAGAYVWFNSVINVSGIATYPTRVVARGGVVQFTANQQAMSVAVPDTVITYSGTAIEASTQYDAGKNQWETTVPSSFSGNVMLTSVPLYLPTGLPGGINPVNWTEHFYSDNPGISVQWQWAAAVYTSFTTNLNAIGVKPIDGSIGNPYNNSDHAGTPENFEPFVIGGARGGGGSNWTGSYSGTASTAIPVDTAPVANAGPPQTVPVQTTVTLDGSGSTDANGDPLTYQWSVQGPTGSTAQLVNPTSVKPTITIDKSGDYVIQLVVNDGILNSSPAQVTISTSNSAPVAVAGGNQKVNVGIPVQLDGTQSYDIDGDALTYQWTLVVPSGSNAALVNPTAGRPKFTPDVLGDYGVTLVVNDGKLNSQPSSLTVTSGDLPPVANAGPAQTRKYQETATLDGTNSYDSDNRLIVYQWSFTSKPANSTTTLSDPTAAQPTFVVDQCGHYAIQLIVFDGFLSSTPASTTVDCANTPPAANAGPPQTVTAETMVQLDGHLTTDVDGDMLTYLWSFTSWPGKDQGQPAPQLSDPKAVQPTFFAPIPGTYVVQLHVDDGQGGGTAASAYSTVTITSDDIAPIANPGSPQKVNLGDTITLDGSKSSSPLNYPLTYSWQFASVPQGSNAVLNNPTSVLPSFTPDLFGTYVVQLQVNDGFLNSPVVTLPLAVNARPVANPGSAQNVHVGDTVTLDGSSSSDVDGDSLTYSWSMLSHPTGSVSLLSDRTVVQPTIVADVAGLYVFQLIVNDGMLDSAPQTVTITATDPNKPPVISAGPNLTGTYPNPVQLQGSVTDDGLPKGAPLTIWWSEVNGPGNAIFSDTTNPQATVTFDQPGTYLLKLSADDTEFERDSTVTITYQTPQNQPPVVNAGPNDSAIAPAVYQLKGSVTDDGYPLGKKLTSAWTQVSGPPDAVFANPSSPTSTVRLNSVGTYVLQLSASDGELQGSSRVTITTSLGNKPPVVNAGPPQTLTLPTVSTTLQGSVSDDGLPAGNSLVATWSALISPGTVTFGSLHSPQSTVTFSTPGAYVLRLTATDGQLNSFADVTITVAPSGAYVLALTPPSAPGLVTGNSQTVAALIQDAAGHGVPGVLVNFSVTGANPQSGTAITNASGLANFAVTSHNDGTDTVVAAGPVNGQQLVSNTSTLYWMTLPVAVATNAANAQFWANPTVNTNGSFDIASGTPPTFVQNFPNIMFNPKPGLVPNQPSNVNTETRPFTDVLVDSHGNYAGLEIAQGNGFQAGVGTMFAFEAVFTGTFVVNAAQNIAFNFYNDDGFVLGIGNGATRVSGPLVNPPASSALMHYPVMGSDEVVTGPNLQTVTIHFPAPGSYPYEVDYDECCDGELSLTMSTAASGAVPSLGTVSITPSQPSALVIGQQRSFTVTVTDAASHAVTNSAVTLTVTGPNHPFVPYTANTDATGTATFSYLGNYTGTDLVQASAVIGGLAVYSNTVQDSWLSSTSAPSQIVLDPPEVGPAVVSGTEALQAIVTDTSGHPLSGLAVQFRVVGVNATSSSVVTGSNGKASFSFNGTNLGTDVVTASVVVNGQQLVSQPATVVWITPPPQAIYTTPVRSSFFTSNGSQSFNIPVTQQPAFTRTFPALTFNPVNGTVQSNSSSVTTGNRPYTNVTVDSSSTYTGTIIAQGNLQQAGVAPMAAFGAVYTGNFVVSAAGNITFNCYGDDGYYLGIGNGATRVSGPTLSTPAFTVFHSYPVMGGINAGESVPLEQITVNFPKPGSYPYEIDYEEDGTFGLSLTVATSQSNLAVPPAATIAVSPAQQAQNNTGSVQQFTILVKDIFGNPVPNAVLSVAINGQNAQGPFQVVADGNGHATFSYQGQQPGNDLVQFTGTIQGMNVVSGEVQVQWANKLNTAPVVNAGSAQTITLPASASLQGTVTDDGLPIGSKVTVQWAVVSGPGNVTFSSPSTVATQANFSRFGTYVLSLSASDTQLSSTATVQITVNPGPNQPPAVNAGASQSAFVGDVVTLAGSVTDDGLPAGAVVTSMWTKVSGPGNVAFGNAGQPSTTANFDQPGIYVLQLAATDTQYTSTAQISIAVNLRPQSANQPPTASVSYPPSIAVGTSGNLSAQVTDDGLPSNTLTYSWTLINGPGTATFTSATQTQTGVSFNAAGSYLLQFAVSDTQLTTTVQFSISVVAQQAQNQPPRASAGQPQTIVLPTNSTTLQGSATDDGLPTGSLTVQWSLISGPGSVTFATPNAASTLATFTAAGVYLLQLSASDGQYTANSSTTVTVAQQQQQGQNQAPVVAVGPNQTITLPNNSVTLTGTAADDGLPTGSTLSLKWVQASGPGAATIATPTQTATTVTLPQAGTYTFTFSANDTLLTSSATVTVNVLAEPAGPVVQINLPEGTEITQPTPISGSITSGNWTVAYAPNLGNGSQPAFQTIASGSGQVSGTLATLDPTMMLNGNYVIQVSARDQWGQSASVSTQVDVDRNLKIGNFTLSFNDMSVPVPGLPIQITRTYDSRNHSVGDFGYGWTLSLANIKVTKSRNFGQNWFEDVNWSGMFPQYCLTAASNRAVSLTFPDGKVYKFQAISTPQCQQDTPIENPTLGFTQIPTDSSTAGARLDFVNQPPLLLDGGVPGPVNVDDYSGNFFDASVFKLTTADGYVYIVDQKLGARQITDPNGNTLTINANGITHSDGQSVVFVRDTQNRITSIQDPNGKSITYNYNAAGNLQSVTDRDQNTTTFGYDPNHPHYLNEIDDPRGAPAVRNTYDDSGRLISTTDASGKTITYDHRLAQNQEAVTDRLGNITVYTYDADGNVTEKDDPVGGITYSTYDSFDNKITESNNVVTKPMVYTYDSLGNRLTETDPLGHTTTYAYNTRKQVTDITDPNGNHSRNVYDNNGNLLSTSVLNTNVPATTYTYYPSGLPNVVTDPSSAPTTFTYDSAGNLHTQSDALGNITTYGYDQNGNKTSQAVTRTKSDGTKETLTTGYAYDNTGRLTKTTYPDGSFTQTVYNSIGKQSDTYDANRNHTHYDYDDNGRLKTVTYPDTTTESYEYDFEGHKTKFTDRAGHATQYGYDKVGRLTQTISLADNSSTQTIYDLAGRVITTQDADQNQTSYGYDDAGRRTSVTDALNNVTLFFYDANGNQTSVTDANLHTVYTDYDQFNRRIRTRYPDKTQESFTYDNDGRLTDKYDQAGKHTNYVYDKLGRLTDVYQAPETLNLHTHYGYDELGNRISQTDANQHTTQYAYDKLGRRSSRTLPLGQSESYLYDNNGNLQSKTDFNGHTTTYSYDAMNRLQSKTADAFFSHGACANACGAAQVGFTYTPTGKRQTMTDASGTTTYTYDNRDRLQSKQTPFGTLTYGYDSASNLLSITSSNQHGAMTSYSYDKLNRLSTVTDNAALLAGAQNAITTYGYDAAGNLGSVAYPNGVTTIYNYNLLNRLTKVTATTQASALANYQYTLGAAGNRTSVTELSGRNVQYGYDDVYRLTSETIAGAAFQNGAIGYAYDAVGNRQQITSTVQAIPSSGTLFYDANDRTATDNYDNNGNTINSGGVGNVYDFENHMVQQGAVTIVYDGDGNRGSETSGGTTTNYLVDTLNPTGYAQVVDELQSGLVTRSYTLGLERISQRQVASSQQLSFYGYDGHGSVRYLTDSTGTITDTYDYDAFGNLLVSTGSTPNNYRFAGEQWDPNLGLYYNRARYLDVGSGRFWSMDTYEGSDQEPSTLNKYTYGANDPINQLDRSGNEFGIGDVAVVSAAVGVLAALSTIAVGEIGYHSTDPKLRGIAVHEAIYPYYRALGFVCNQAIGTIGDPPVDYARPDCRHPGNMFPYAPWPFTGEVYEIKPNDPSQIAEGLQEVSTYYIPRLFAHSPRVPWHPGTQLLTPRTIILPQFRYIVFHLSIPVPGVIAYDPQPDYEEAARVGITAAALTFIILTIKELPPERLPDRAPAP